MGRSNPQAGWVEALEGRVLLFSKIGGGSIIITNPGGDWGPTYRLSNFVDANGILMFTNADGVHGTELWRSDGTPEGTRMVKDVRPGEMAGAVGPFVAPNGVVYFAGNDGEHGSELWRSGGTRRSTFMVEDLTYLGETDPHGFQAEGNTVLFHAHGGPASVYRTDGTARNTDWLDGVNGYKVALAGGKVFYLERFDEENWWQHESGPEQLWLEGDDLFQPYFMHPAFDGADIYQDGGRLLFYRGDLGEVWSFDPVAVSMTRIATVPAGRDLISFERVGGRLILALGTVRYSQFVGFGVAEKVSGTAEIYVSNGSGGAAQKLWQHTFADVSKFSWDKLGLSVVGDAVYFTPIVNKYGALWRTDGTVAGTRRVMASADRSNVTNLVNNAGTLYFVNSGKLWTSDGTPAGTRAVVDLPSPKQGPGTAPELTAAGGKLFFVGSDPQRGATLWAYDPGAAEKLRRLSTSAPPVVLEKGKLTVYGYEWDDRIVVSRKKKTLSVNWNGTRYGYAAAEVRAVHVYGNAGRDVITANAGVGIAVMLDGGDGDDSLTGGVGNDVLRGSGGADTLVGGAGDDSLDGGYSIDWLYGDGGNDLLRSQDGTADFFWGGSGIDTGQMDEDDTREGIERLVE